MTFKHAFAMMKKGIPMKLPSWGRVLDLGF